MGLFDGITDFVGDVLPGVFGGAAQGGMMSGGNPWAALAGGLGGGLLGAFSDSDDGKMPDWMEDYYKAQTSAGTDILNMPAPNPPGAPYAPVAWGNQQLRSMMPDFFSGSQDAFNMANQSGMDAYRQLQNANPMVNPISSSNVIGQAENFMNPYTENVIDAVRGDLDLARAEAIQGEENRRLGAGTYGGGRHGVSDSLTNRDYMNTLARTTSGLRQSGMDNALSLAMQNVARQQGTRQQNVQNAMRRLGATMDLSNLFSGQGGQQFGLGAGIAADEQARDDMHAAHMYGNRMRQAMWPITRLQAAQGINPPQQGYGGDGNMFGNIMSGALAGAGIGNQLFGRNDRRPDYFRRVGGAGIDLSNFLNF